MAKPDEKRLREIDDELDALLDARDEAEALGDSVDDAWHKRVDELLDERPHALGWSKHKIAKERAKLNREFKRTAFYQLWLAEVICDNDHNIRRQGLKVCPGVICKDPVALETFARLQKRGMPIDEIRGEITRAFLGCTFEALKGMPNRWPAVLKTLQEGASTKPG